MVSATNASGGASLRRRGLGLPKLPGIPSDISFGPMSPLHASTPAPMHASLPAFRHRGFELDIRTGGAGFTFAVSHEGLALHASEATHRSATSAERAARQFVDDALAAFACPAPAYTA